jgi:hypothetical protein
LLPFCHFLLRIEIADANAATTAARILEFSEAMERAASRG